MTPAVIAKLNADKETKAAKAEETKERQALKKTSMAEKHVALRKVGEAVLEKLRVNREVRCLPSHRDASL